MLLSKDTNCNSYIYKNPKDFHRFHIQSSNSFFDKQIFIDKGHHIVGPFQEEHC